MITFAGCVTHDYALEEQNTSNKIIPAAFFPSSQTLLIEMPAVATKINSENAESMKAQAKKLYPYNYVFSTADEIYSKVLTYPASKEYQFALVSSTTTSPDYITINTDGSRKLHRPSKINQFYIYDRISDKNYAPLGSGSGTLTIAFKWALQELNSGIKKNN